MSQNDRPRPGKSVRWTGRDEHRDHEAQEQHEDYFSFPGGSANQMLNTVDNDSSDSGSTSEEEHDEGAMHVRAATRANTWFNRMRQENSDIDEDYSNEQDDHSFTQPLIDHDLHHPLGLQNTTNTNTASPSHQEHHPQPQQQQQQQQQLLQANNFLNPYSYLMDLGTHVSGGLAPGGAEMRSHEDPLDDEYRERRDQLLASLGSHSTPSSPREEVRNPLDPDAIPLKSMPPRSHGSYDEDHEEEESDGPIYFNINRRNVGEPSLQPPTAVSPGAHDAHEQSDIPKTPEIRVFADTSSSSEISSEKKDDQVYEAEKLRHQLELKQRERTHRMEEIIRSREQREEKRRQRRVTRETAHSGADNTNDGGHSSPRRSGESLRQHITREFSRASHASHTSHTSRASETSSTKDDEDDAKEAEELKRLEEAAKQEAEDEAKLLVMSHLNTNLLDPNNNNDGYIENNRYLLDSGIEDDDLDVDEGRDNGDNHDSKDDSKEASTDHSGNNNSKENDSSDSDDDSDDGDQNKHVNLRGDPDYVPPPKKVKEGVLGSLLRLYAGQEEDDDKSLSSAAPSPMVSAAPSPLPSPGGTPPGDASFDAGDTPPSSTSPDYSVSTDDYSLSSSKGGKRWKRPSYFRTHSTEDALGREKVGRPKWYKRPTYSKSNSISELATSGLAAASNAAHQSLGATAHSISATAHHAHTPSIASSGYKLSSKFKGKSSATDLAAAEAKHERKTQEMQRHLKEKEARKQAKKAEQAERERKKAIKRARLAEQARITVHIADVLQRQRFLLRFGRALMLFGAPSHRLEEYLKITARVLEIDAQFLYMPGCMLVSFGDATTHTSETKLLRVTQGLNLNKLHATHLIYKEVVHDLMSLEEASSHIDHLLRSNNLYPWWLVVFFYGIACVCCGMFAYGAWWTDMPIIFCLGAGVGFLQFWCQPKSDLYANVFEVSSSVVVSMIGRAFGSIGRKLPDGSERVFCFAAITQASLALILPGYIILVGALELQTKNLVAGSVRMFYANIYSLFLSFGMTLGSTIFGWIYHGATTETSCRRTIDPLWKILFVPTATLFMAVVNQAGPRQLPIMVIIGSAGFAVQYFVQKKVKNAASFTSAIGAFTMGVIGNLYSRVGHGLAFAAMLPGIFVLVPSGIAAQDSFVAGLQAASQIVNGSRSASEQSQQTSTSISELGNSMTQVAVGIVVGLFAATLVVYPLGIKKKRSGLFTF